MDKKQSDDSYILRKIDEFFYFKGNSAQRKELNEIFSRTINVLYFEKNIIERKRRLTQLDAARIDEIDHEVSFYSLFVSKTS